MNEEIGKKVWQIPNERIKKLSEQTRRELFELVKEDVETAIANNGYFDPITKEMIWESVEIGDYWGVF